MKSAPKRPLKRIFDIVLSILGLIILSPIYILIAVAIIIEGIIDPLTKGPVINPEYRISRGRRFVLFKFRTIRTAFFKEVQRDRENKTQSTLQLKPGAITRVGSFLAKYYLDELPQLANIVICDMSLGGPRPQPVTAFRKGKEQFQSLGEIRGGLAGLCQACKRNQRLHKAFLDTYNCEKNHPKLKWLDDIYLEKYKNYSALRLLVYDIKIMFMTLKVNIKAEGYLVGK